MPSELHIPSQLNDVFLKHNVSITLPNSTSKLTFKDLDEFVEFVKREEDFWAAFGDGNAVYKAYRDLRIAMDKSVNRYPVDPTNARNSLGVPLNNFRLYQWPYISSKPQKRGEQRRC